MWLYQQLVAYVGTRVVYAPLRHTDAYRANMLRSAWCRGWLGRSWVSGVRMGRARLPSQTPASRQQSQPASWRPSGSSISNYLYCRRSHCNSSVLAHYPMPHAEHIAPLLLPVQQASPDTASCCAGSARLMAPPPPATLPTPTARLRALQPCAPRTGATWPSCPILKGASVTSAAGTQSLAAGLPLRASVSAQPLSIQQRRRNCIATCCPFAACTHGISREVCIENQSKGCGAGCSI